MSESSRSILQGFVDVALSPMKAAAISARGASRAPASPLICRGCVCRCAGVMRSGVGEEQALSPREVCGRVGGIRCAV